MTAERLKNEARDPPEPKQAYHIQLARLSQHNLRSELAIRPSDPESAVPRT